MEPCADAVVAIDLADEAATCALAGAVAGAARRGDVIALWGDLGSGKSVFARAFVNALPGGPEEVPSPTFTLVQSYRRGPFLVHHVDLYRLGNAEETMELGLEEGYADGITLIEWPDRLGPRLPAVRLDLRLGQGAREDAREATLAGSGDWPERLAERIAHA